MKRLELRRMPVQFDWKAVWDRKAGDEPGDQYVVSGFEHFNNIDTEAIAHHLCRLCKIESGHSILEIGCGGGLLGRHLSSQFEYVGTDYSAKMVQRAIELNRFSAVRTDADNIIFKDKSFDHVFAFGVFHYFPDYEYAKRAISEMERVARKTVCISDITAESKEPMHLLYTEDFFPGYQISSQFYERPERRFTATRYLE